MSEAVRAALAAKRAAAKQQVASRSRSSSPVKSGAAGASSSGSSQLADSVATLRASPSRTDSPPAPTSSKATRNVPRSNRGDAEESETSVGDLSGYIQPSLGSLLHKACSSGKLGITFRVPALKALPEELFDLAKGPEPSWHEKARGDRAWYERQDLRLLQANGNALVDLDERIGEFRALQKIEVSRALPCLGMRK